MPPEVEKDCNYGVVSSYFWAKIFHQRAFHETYLCVNPGGQGNPIWVERCPSKPGIRRSYPGGISAAPILPIWCAVRIIVVSNIRVDVTQQAIALGLEILLPNWHA